MLGSDASIVHSNWMLDVSTAMILNVVDTLDKSELEGYSKCRVSSRDFSTIEVWGIPRVPRHQ